MTRISTVGHIGESGICISVVRMALEEALVDFLSFFLHAFGFVCPAEIVTDGCDKCICVIRRIVVALADSDSGIERRLKHLSRLNELVRFVIEATDIVQKLRRNMFSQSSGDGSFVLSICWAQFIWQ